MVNTGQMLYADEYTHFKTLLTVHFDLVLCALVLIPYLLFCRSEEIWPTKVSK